MIPCTSHGSVFCVCSVQNAVLKLSLVVGSIPKALVQEQEVSPRRSHFKRTYTSGK